MIKPVVIPTTGQDWANRLSHEVSGNGAICLAVLLSAPPDPAALESAVGDLIGMQPVLGCRFDDAQSPPVWVSAGDAVLFETLTAENLCDGLNDFMRGEPTRDAAMKAALLTTPRETALCLAFDHAAIDGGGAKKCLSLLGACYAARVQGRRAAILVTDDRSDAGVYARCGLVDYRMAIKRDAPAPGAPATTPYGGTDGRRVAYRWIDMPLAAVRRAEGTVTDCLIAALMLALSARCPDAERFEAHMTVDLRRYLDEASAPAAANLSGMEPIAVSAVRGRRFGEIAAEVNRRTVAIKNGRPGVSGAAMMTYLRTIPYAQARAFLTGAGEKSRASGVAAPILSNLGLLAPDAMPFGDIAVTGVIPLLPAMRAPAFMLGAAGYGDTLTVSAGFYAEERSCGDIERLLADIRDCLTAN